MPPSATPARLVILTTDGDIAPGDRTGRTALAAARAGWDVTVLCPGDGSRTERGSLGSVSVVRVPVGTALRDRAARTGPGHRLRRLTQLGLPDREAYDRTRAAHQAWVRVTSARAAETAGPARTTLKAWMRLRRTAHRVRCDVFRWEERRDRKPARGDWATRWPALLDRDVALGPVLEKLRPAVVLVVGAGLLATASISATRLRTLGLSTRWAYEAVWADRDPAAPDADVLDALVREFAGKADAVTAALPALAEGVVPPDRVLVVPEAPWASAAATGGHPQPAVRDLCGLHGAGPLWVWPADHPLAPSPVAVVGALAELNDHHLAVLGDRGAAPVKELLRLADEAGLRDRVHLPAPPGDGPGQAAAYLASADIAVVGPDPGLPGLPERDLLAARYGLAGLRLIRAGDQPRDLAKAVVEGIAAGRPSARTWEENVAPLLDRFAELAGHPALEPIAVAPEAPRRPVPIWTPLSPDTPVRLTLGPANYAGQLSSFAHAICRSRPDVSAQVITAAAAAGGFRYPADVRLDSSRLGRLTVQLEQIERVFAHSTHVLADAFHPLLGRFNGNHIEGDLPALLRPGLKVALLAHGSEVRHPGRHRERHPNSHFHDAPEGLAERLTAVAERNRSLVERTGLPAFVTTPDLLDDLPTATWAPLVVNVDAFACDRPVMERARPVVLHAPSTRWTKGTDRVLPVLHELHERRVIEFRLAEGVEWAGMREMVRDCDIVVDQFAIGSYGTFACEGMAAGKPVVAYLTDSVRERYAPELPIVNATPKTLRATLESLLDDRTATAELGIRSAAFAREFHDGTKTASVLAEFLT
ncbi:glycosyl transferase family 1 [Streptomyces sp. NPDC004609]|uniref:glycosyl transferase family 1 n=1 Tax=Streptomyces sp. NPDC004609 TaxID=3364704 RepID=UPI0036798067